MRLIKNLIPSNLKTLSLPEELMENPFISMKGNRQISIENEYTLLSFTANEIKVRYRLGIIMVTGTDLMIRTMYPDEMICQGNIIQVSFHKHV